MSENDDQQISLAVRTLAHGDHTIVLPATATVGELKTKLESCTQVASIDQRILHRGRELADNGATLQSLALTSGNVVHMATRPSGMPAQAPNAPGPGAGADLQQNMPPHPPFQMPPQFRPVAGVAGPGMINGMPMVMGPFQVQVSGDQQNGVPSPEQMQQMGQAISQLVSNVMAGAIQPPVAVHTHAHAQAQAQGQAQAQAQAQGTAPAAAGGNTQPTGLHFQVPLVLDERGNLIGASVLEGLDRMLVRLLNGNMEEDPLPPLSVTPSSSLRNPSGAGPWSQAAERFLRAAHVILTSAPGLGTPTIQSLNRVFTTAGMSPVNGSQSTVSSFPLQDVDSEDSPHPYPHPHPPPPPPPPTRPTGGSEQAGSGTAPSTAQLPPQLPLQPLPWFEHVSDADLILVAAVTAGELTRRYLEVLNVSSAGVNNLVANVAERLRSLSSVEAGAAQRDVLRQIRLVAGHIIRLGSTASELGRLLIYLGSALDTQNMQFLQLNPGYLSFPNQQGGDNVRGLNVVPNFGIGTAVPLRIAHTATATATSPTFQIPAMGQIHIQAMAVDASNSPPVNLRDQRQVPQASGANAAPGANTAPPSTQAQDNPVSRILQSLPPELQASVSSLMSTMGVQSTQEADELINHAGGAVNAIRQLMVTSMDVGAVAREVTAAVQNVLRDSSIASTDQLRSQANAIGDRIDEEVRGILTRYMGQITSNQDVLAFSEDLRQLFGVNLAEVASTEGSRGGQAAPAPAPAPAPAEQVSAPAEQVPAQTNAQSSVPATQTGPPAGLGLGGSGLRPRRPAGASSRGERAGGALGSSSVPTASVPTSTVATPGNGGGLASLLQNVMGNPAVMDIARSPAFHQMAGQLFGGSTPTSMPTSSSMSAGTRDLDALLAADLTPEEASRWKEILERDTQVQREMGEQPEFSEAYLAAMPQRTGGGFLGGILPDQE